jgi:hypothetical protein
MSIGRVRESFFECRFDSLITNFSSRSSLMASHKVSKQWILHGTCVQLQQSTTIQHNPLSTKFDLLSILKAAITPNHLQLETCPHSFEFPIKPLLYAKLCIIDSTGTNTTFR